MGDPAQADRIEGPRGIGDTIQREDIAVRSGGQLGLRSRRAAPGPLSHLEKSITRFAA